MLLIVAHHYVVNSGLYNIVEEAPLTASSVAMLLFGAWGKTGINCFVFITGYFMCQQLFSWQKLIKLYLQIIFYAIAIYGVFCITGHEEFSLIALIRRFFPIYSINNDFVACFILFYLFIPFINILIKALDKQQHGLLILLAFVIYTLLPSVGIKLAFNYVSWFIIIYLMASYIRFYDFGSSFSHRIWGIITILAILIGAVSTLVLFGLYKFDIVSKSYTYFFISDSNKIMALLIAVSSFMWFKDLRIPYSRFINAVGATTFGVLLIHANSDTMRQWLWRETVDCIGHFGDSILWTLGYAMLSVFIVFTVCSGIDWFRGKLIEPWLTSFFTKIIRSIKSRLSARLIA